MNQKVFLFILALSSAYFSASGQRTLKGIVVDSITLNAVPNAAVKIKGTGRGTITNAGGIFLLKVKETDTLVISSIGYVRVTVPVDTDGEIMFVRMIEDAIMLKEVTVYGRGEAKKKILPSLKLKSGAVPWGGALPNSGGGAAVNLDYFSKREREKRKLEKLKTELASTQTYVEIVTNLEVIDELKDRFSLSDTSFYKILTHFNEQHREITHSGNQATILNSLFSFFETEVRFRRTRH
jgi:hypothetical protein